jgi:hypothetical protein
MIRETESRETKPIYISSEISKSHVIYDVHSIVDVETGRQVVIPLIGQCMPGMSLPSSIGPCILPTSWCLGTADQADSL